MCIRDRIYTSPTGLSLISNTPSEYQISENTSVEFELTIGDGTSDIGLKIENTFDVSYIHFYDNDIERARDPVLMNAAGDDTYGFFVGVNMPRCNIIYISDSTNTILFSDSTKQNVFVYTKDNDEYKLTSTLPGPNEFGHSVAVSPDDSIVVVSDNSDNIYRYNLSNDGCTLGHTYRGIKAYTLECNDKFILASQIPSNSSDGFIKSYSIDLLDSSGRYDYSDDNYSGYGITSTNFSDNDSCSIFVGGISSIYKFTLLSDGVINLTVVWFMPEHYHMCYNRLFVNADYGIITRLGLNGHVESGTNNNYDITFVNSTNRGFITALGDLTSIGNTVYDVSNSTMNYLDNHTVIDIVQATGSIESFPYDKNDDIDYAISKSFDTVVVANKRTSRVYVYKLEINGDEIIDTSNNTLTFSDEIEYTALDYSGNMLIIAFKNEPGRIIYL